MPRKLLFFFGLIILVAGGWLSTQFLTAFMPVTRIDCQVNDSACPDDLIARVRALENKSLFFTNFDQAIVDLNLEFFELTDLSKKLPGTLVLKFSPRQSRYALILPNQEKWIVTEAGSAQQLVIDTPLPEIQISGHWTQPIKDHSIDPTLHQPIIQLLASLEANQVSYRRIEFKSPNEIEITLDDRRRALVAQDQLAAQIEKLAIIQRNLDLNTIETGIKTIDLRFNLPVLKT